MLYFWSRLVTGFADFFALLKNRQMTQVIQIDDADDKDILYGL